MDIQEHIVRFDLWCDKCKHKDTDEINSPCNECLDDGGSYESRRPTLYEPQEK